MAQSEVAYVDVAGRRIAYRLRDGTSPPLVFLPGYASDMEGTKALALDTFAERRGGALLRLDYSGTGSSGGRFEDGTLARWLEEALAAIDRLTAGQLIIVGSSMGGWIALHLALLRPDRVRAVVGIAAAPDFTAWGFDSRARRMLAGNGRLGEPMSDGSATPRLMTKAFWDSGQQLRLLTGEIPIDCPVRLIHGEQDSDVPLDVAFRLIRALRSSDVQLNVLKGGGHRLSEPREIDAILRSVAALLEPAS
jgi:pimeloyl-ACP methyl ester carboxylesterase